MALPPQFRKKGSKESAEPKKGERMESKMPAKMRAAMEKKEMASFKKGGKVSKKC